MRGQFGLYGIAAIALVGKPYVDETRGIDTNEVFDSLVFDQKYQEKVPYLIEKNRENLAPLGEKGYHGIDSDLKHGKNLSFEDTFSLATFVCCTSNRTLYEEVCKKYPLIPDRETLRMQAVSLLAGMSVKESLVGLSATEIAGLVAGVLELDTVIRISSGEPTFVFGGMGGDRGLSQERSGVSKLFSVSTLASLAMGLCGPVHKHHSYPNTSKVAGQSAVESLGARSDFRSDQDFRRSFDFSRTVMSSCHSVRTVHRISHRLKGETINHIIGPLAAPHASDESIHACIGVNQNVHPQTIIEAIRILEERGIQSYGNSVAFCGIDKRYDEIDLDILDQGRYYENSELKNTIALDEVPPPPHTTLASFHIEGSDCVTVLIAPEDFMSEDEAREMEHDGLLIPNVPDDILKANSDVIHRADLMKARYVAMTGALALFTRDYASRIDAFDHHQRRVNPAYLRACFREVLSKITSETYTSQAHLYIESTQKDSLPGIDAILFDVDNTLIKPNDYGFYQQFSKAVERALSRYLNVDEAEGKRIADYYRKHYGGGERALFQGDIHIHFPEYSKQPADYQLLYDEMSSVDPSGYFENNDQLLSFLTLLKSQGKKIVALTDAPEALSRKMLHLSGIDPDEVFDLYVSYQRDSGPQKILHGSQAFIDIAQELQIDPKKILAIGDTPQSDILPAQKAGMRTCLLNQEESGNQYGLEAKTVFEVPYQYRSNYQLENQNEH